MSEEQIKIIQSQSLLGFILRIGNREIKFDGTISIPFGIYRFVVQWFGWFGIRSQSLLGFIKTIKLTEKRTYNHYISIPFGIYPLRIPVSISQQAYS